MPSHVNKFGFSRWNFQFELNGSTTLDPEKDHKLLRRIAGRKQLFMDPILNSGFLKRRRVLDLGSNSGYWSYVALTEGGAAHVTGVEASPELVRQANFVFETKEIDRGNYSFVVADAYAFMETCQDHFDVVLCLGFFYHINDPMRLLALMHQASAEFVIIDTVVHKSEEALISVRPVVRKYVIAEANITLELVSSRKAIFWMAEEIGFKETRLLTAEYERVSSMWDYFGGFRECFVLSKSLEINTIWPNAVNPGYIGIQEDLRKFGYFPEMHRKGGRSGL